MNLFFKYLLQELNLFRKNPQVIVQSAAFFFMFIIIVPMTMPHDLILLKKIVPGIFWMAVLLVYFLSSLFLFQQDYRDGVIEQWVVSGESLALLFGVKVWLHGFLLTVIIFFLAPMVSIIFHLNFATTFLCYVGFFCGAPSLFLIAALAAAIGSNVEQRGFLILLLLFPLAIPVMIFGSAIFNNIIFGLPISGLVAILLFLSCIATAFLPIAIASVARMLLVDA